MYISRLRLKFIQLVVHMIEFEEKWEEEEEEEEEWEGEEEEEF